MSHNAIVRVLSKLQSNPTYPIVIMKPSHLLLASSIAIALVSCANQKTNYDTHTPIVEPPTTAANTPAQPANPTYDTPPAYEDSAAPPVSPDAVVPPTPTTPGRPARPAGTVASGTTHVATVHTVVAHDTLSGIAGKYKVPIASIKKANNMTSDTVVLGKKLVIPAQ